MSEKSVVLNQCQKITKDFINNPLSMLFVHLSFGDKKSHFEYTSRIKEPMDLTTVNKRLKENCYSNIQEWAYDMDLIFNNAILFNGKNSIVGGVAIYLQKHFNKKLKELEAWNLRNYEEQLMQLSDSLEKLLREPPQDLNIELDDGFFGDNGEERDFTISRMKKLESDLQKAVKNGKTKEIAELLNEINPNEKFDENSEIDLSHLGRNSLVRLEKFVKDQ